jgi:anti-sigma factor RsiW
MTDEEEFFSWLDGELASADAARVEARVAASPALAAEAEAHRAMTAGLRTAFTPVMTPKSEVVDFASRRARRGPAGLPQWAAIAATLVIGIGLGTLVERRPASDAPVALEGGRMVAAAALDRTLTRQLASAGEPNDGTRIGLTFRNGEGHMCRTFSSNAASGLACRAGGAWAIEGLYRASGPASGNYRMAAGSDPRLAALVDDMIAGEPLDGAGEAAARQAGWR